MSRDIYQGSSYITGNGRRVNLDQISFIFVCPDCEYRMTGLTEENVVAIRNRHNATCHSHKVVDVHWDDMQAHIDAYNGWRRDLNSKFEKIKKSHV